MALEGNYTGINEKFSEGLCRFPKERFTKYGFIDISGDWIIEPQYDYASDFKNGSAAVEIDGKQKIINKKGDEVDPSMIVDKFVSEQKNEYGRIMWDKRVYLSDMQFENIIKTKYSYIKPIEKYEYFRARSEEHDVILNSNFKELISEERKSMRDEDIDDIFMNNEFENIYLGNNILLNKTNGVLYKVNQNQIEKLSNQITFNIRNTPYGEPYKYQFINGLCRIDERYSFIFINPNSDLVIDRTWGFAKHFSEGLIGVRFIIGESLLNSMTWGFIDINKKLVIDTLYEEVRNFSDGLAGFKLNKYWGFIDQKGNQIIKAQFEDVKDFVNGFTFYKMSKKWGVLSKDGTKITKPIYKEVEMNFRDGLAQVRIDINSKSQFIYINTKGEQVWPKKED